MHILAERGLIDYERPVAEYWPEFAHAGKGSVSAAQALNHLAGIPQSVQVAGKSTAEIWADLDLCVTEVARFEPIFPPGSRVCYHALSFGWIAEGIVRGLGLSLGEVVAEEIVKPLRMDGEMYLGTPTSEHDRLATPFEKPPSGEPAEIDPLVLRCVPPDITEALNRPEVRSTQVAAANMSVTARALARHYAALVGEVDGCRLVSQAHLERVLAQRTDLPDVLYQLNTAPTRKRLRAQGPISSTWGKGIRPYTMAPIRGPSATTAWG